jgi:hypothetical protein
MTYEGKQVSKNFLEFDVWKLQLRNDCESQGKLSVFNAMGDYVLQLLWAIGLDPSVKAIVEHPAEYKLPPNSAGSMEF